MPKDIIIYLPKVTSYKFGEICFTSLPTVKSQYEQICILKYDVGDNSSLS